MLTVVIVLILAVIGATVVVVRRDGLGYRPGPRSHEIETQGSSWPHRDVWPR